MANPYQQRARQRKFIYAILIVALFTVSLIHRKWVVEPEAQRLQLREVARGEAELTSAAVRLALTGSSGLAVTFLWNAALEKQERHEWNELELLVGTITKLQPYFITPWLFQSWNLSFNVAVECDRPRDKYYYVSRGAQLLAEGERRNHLDPFPGNPEMRHFMGSLYQIKIGHSDERNTMQCLLDMSCIDPAQRNAEKLWSSTAQGRDVNLREFELFCKDNPRLVRRLREKIGYNAPIDIVRFFEDNKDIPSRFEKSTWGIEQTQTRLKPVNEQFPILPEHEADWPDPATPDLSLTNESFDVYVVSRTWFAFAMKPLPPIDFDNTLHEKQNYDQLHYRLPKMIASIIFRGYVGLAQSSVGENLEEEGWFDQDGWVIHDWFERERGFSEEETRIGTERKYWARPAWDKAYELYRDYGRSVGLYMTPAERQDYERKAQLVRTKYGVSPENLPAIRSDLLVGELKESYDAQQRLMWNAQYRNMTNFDAHFNQTVGERQPEAVLGRKLLFEAEQLRKGFSPEQAVEYYKQAWPIWIDVMLAYPEYPKVDFVTESVYDLQLNYLPLLQPDQAPLLKPLAMGMAQMTLWPNPPVEELMTPAMKQKIIPIRDVRGPLDWIQIYDVPNSGELKEFLLQWTQAPQFGMPMVYPRQANLMLTKSVVSTIPPPPGWRNLINTSMAELVRMKRTW